MQTHQPSRAALWIIAIFLGLIALRQFWSPNLKASADSSRFDHVLIISPLFLYKGQQGLLVMDKRNGNIWFMGRQSNELNVTYNDPVLVTKIPFEKLDQAPQ
jgi:hypothetical protein